MENFLVVHWSPTNGSLLLFKQKSNLTINLTTLTLNWPQTKPIFELIHHPLELCWLQWINFLMLVCLTLQMCYNQVTWGSFRLVRDTLGPAPPRPINAFSVHLVFTPHRFFLPISFFAKRAFGCVWVSIDIERWSRRLARVHIQIFGAFNLAHIT